LVVRERATHARLPERASMPLEQTSRADACASCHRPGQNPVDLANDATGERILVCPRCLRSNMRMQAHLSESRGALLLRDYAEEYGFQVWRSRDVAYLLPPVAPFAARSATQQLALA
jgi:hypothetical protein